MLEEVVAAGNALARGLQPYFAVLIFLRQVYEQLVVLVLEPPDTKLRENGCLQKTGEVYVRAVQPVYTLPLVL